MKIRLDFVTNSSSSSFVVFGINSENLNLDLPDEETFETEFDGSMSEFIDSKIDENSPLQSGSAYSDGDEVWIGIGPLTLKNKFANRKISEIGQIVAEEIKKAFGVDIDPKKVGYIEESSYNG